LENLEPVVRRAVVSKSAAKMLSVLQMIDPPELSAEEAEEVSDWPALASSPPRATAATAVGAGAGAGTMSAAEAAPFLDWSQAGPSGAAAAAAAPPSPPGGSAGLLLSAAFVRLGTHDSEAGGEPPAPKRGRREDERERGEQ
jgi:hypothetical protein